MTLPAGTRLGPYEILEPLGAGGMGEVYRARDPRLERDVAIKVLPEHLSRDPAALSRFEREAKLLASLSHPNVLGILDVGSGGSVAYAATELLEGETLRHRLETLEISWREAAAIAAAIAEGLAAAHSRGIVHRDLKPENVFLTSDGRVKLLDFGLARREHPTSYGGDSVSTTLTQQTEPGTVMGTVGYMSPEQVRGEPGDARSDIFSFGCVLYEMLTGRRAFLGKTSGETLAAILRDDPADPMSFGKTFPTGLARVVKHCLAREPAQRFQSAKDIVLAMSEISSAGPTSDTGTVKRSARTRAALILAVGVVAVASLSVLLVRRIHKSPHQVGTVKRLAVLPFENLGAPEDDYFADGIADAIRGKLTTLPSVQVIARASSTPYKKTKKTPRQIAEDLDVGYLLTATVRWQKGSGGANRVEVSPELVEISDSGSPTSKWQQPFEAALTDVFQVQSDIATRVAQALGVALGAGDGKRLSERPTQNLAAYDAFLRGEEISKSMGVIDPPTLRQALSFYDRAVALDPSFAQAWAQVSRANTNLYFFNVPEPELGSRAKLAAEKALALAPNRPEGYLALADYKRWVVKDYNAALALSTRDSPLAFGNAELLSATALTEEYLGRWDAALEHLRQAERLDPRSVLAQRRLAEALLLTRRFEEAREVCDRGLQLSPADLWVINQKARSFLGQGDLAGAQAMLKAASNNVEPTTLEAFIANIYDLVWVLDEPQREILLRLTPSAFNDDRGAWGLCLLQAAALKGDGATMTSYAEEARKAFEEHVRASPQDAQQHALLGVVLAYLGRKDEAIREGERSVELLPVTTDGYDGPYYQHQLVRIYMLVHEPEKALDRLEPLLRIPYFLSPGWLKIDPNFDPLRKNPRFQKLIAGK